MPTLLLADDSVTLQRVIALTFAAEPIEVVAVGDGRQAMEKMAAATPDIVLAGTTLPHVNGYDLAAFMRSKRELQRVPVLLLAGAFEAVDKARVEASGANGVIEKPVEPTVVIRRVKELLGLQSEATPAVQGRLVTSADTAARQPVPVSTPPRAVTSTRGTPSTWEQLRTQTGLDASTRSVEDPSSRGADYLDSLDDALDSLDRHLSGRAPREAAAGRAGRAGRPAADATGDTPVFEVDEEWFGQNPAAAESRAERGDIIEDLQQTDWHPAKPAPAANSVFEVDDEWFAEADKVRATKEIEQRQLADDMGIHDVDLPPREAPPTVEIDLDIHQIAPPASDPAPAPAPAPSTSAPAVADDLSKPLAFEQGERRQPPAPVQPPPPQIRVVTPEVTPEMLEEIATRVADRLNASAFGEGLREAMTATIRDTVRSVVSETSERLVREEIDRIKSRKA